jgi:hypothetical protein
MLGTMAPSCPIRCLVLGAVALAAGGCPSPCTAGADPTLAIGTGETSYVPLDPVAPTFDIVHGPQGGYHVLVGLEATQMDTSDLLAADLKGTIDGVLMGETQPWVQMRCNGRTETQQSWNNRLIWDAQPEDLDGRTAHIEATVTDPRGTSVSAAVDALLYDPLLHQR